MLADLRSLEYGSEIEADLCIVGAGAAGLLLARELAGSPLRVCVLESGGEALEPETQHLYAGSSIGLDYYALDETRLRMLGGSTNHWEGWCGPLDPIDLEARTGIPESGWPLRFEELLPYYPKAQRLLGLGPFRYDEEAFEDLGIPAPAFLPERIRIGFWQRQDPPLRVGSAFRKDLQAAKNVTVLLHANATRLQREPGSPLLRHVSVASLSGRRARVRARAFVLACGGLENPRLLLASNDESAAGLGNTHDWVGRTFMDHYRIEVGDLVAPDASLPGWNSWHKGPAGVPYLAAYRLGEALQRETGAPNSALALVRPSETHSGAEASGAELWRTLSDQTEGLYRRLLSRPPQHMRLRAFGDPVPNPSSRVRLGPDRDALGMPRIVLDWRMDERDRRGLATLVTTLGGELARLGLGRVRLDSWLQTGSEWGPGLLAGHHPMGTTRMAASPRQGVVDADCRLHECANLYVAGSSVFPTAGWMNPTLTILALTLRLAGHLERELTTAPALKSDD